LRYDSATGIFNACLHLWKLGMLFQLSTQIRHCQEQADRCRDCADRTNDPIVRDDYVRMAENWLRLAQSFELSERMSRFIAERRDRD
jgi:hypothetical protein